MGPLAIADLPEVAPDDHWGFLGKVVADEPDLLQVLRCTMEPDGGAHEHVHPDRDHVFLLLEGALRMTLGDEPSFVASAGQTVHVPAGIPHAVRNDQGATAGYVAISYRAGGDGGATGG